MIAPLKMVAQAALPDVSAPFVCEIDVLEACLDPVQTYDVLAEGIAALMHDTLFRFDASGACVPELAEIWSGHGCEWHVTLKDDRRFSNGELIEARCFVEAFAAFECEGPRRWIASVLESIVATDRRHLVIRTSRPIGYLPELLSCVVFAPRADNPVIGSGPYCLAQVHEGGRGLLLCREGASPRAWDDGPRWLSMIRTENGYQGVRMFAAGAIQLTCGTVMPHELTRQPQYEERLRSASSMLTGVLMPNADRCAGLGDIACREALSLAIDRERFARTLHPVVEALEDLSASWGRIRPPRAGADADGAQAAWKKVQSPPREVEILYADFLPNRALLEHVAEDIERALPVSVRLKGMDYPGLLSAVAKGEYDLAYCILAPAFPDPAAILLPFATPCALPPGMPEPDADFLAAFADAEQYHDGTERAEAMTRAAKLFMQSMPVIPLARTRICHLVAEGWEVPVLPVGLPDYARIRRSHG